MNSIKFILILSLFVTNAKSSRIEVVGKMTEVFKAIKDIDYRDILAITHSVLNFVAVGSYLGPFAAIAGEILGMVKKDDALEQSFHEMEGHLDLIEMKLDQLFCHIEAVSVM